MINVVIHNTKNIRNNVDRFIDQYQWRVFLYGTAGATTEITTSQSTNQRG